MTDIACWRQGENFVVRYHGSEHLMAYEDFIALVHHVTTVLDGADESLGAEYADLRASNRRKSVERPKLDLSSLIAGLGLTTPEVQKVRRI